MAIDRWAPPRPDAAGRAYAETAARTAGWLPFSPWHLLLMPTGAAVRCCRSCRWCLTSFMTDADINRFPPRFIPHRVCTLTGYAELFQRVAHPALAAQLDDRRRVDRGRLAPGAVLAGRLRLRPAASSPAARSAFFLIVATIMIPTQLLMIPTYVMFARLGARRHPRRRRSCRGWPSAFGIFLMRQFFLSLPVELEEAARIDGCTTFGVFWRIVLPLAKPALATLAIFTLLGSWNDLIWPLIAISDEHWYTLQLGLTNFQGTRRTEWSLLMAGNVVATLPLIIALPARAAAVRRDDDLHRPQGLTRQLTTFGRHSVASACVHAY